MLKPVIGVNIKYKLLIRPHCVIIALGSIYQFAPNANHNYSKLERNIPCPPISLNFIKIAARILKAAIV